MIIIRIILIKIDIITNYFNFTSILFKVFFIIIIIFFLPSTAIP